jgi:type IV secretion system protein VirB10
MTISKPDALERGNDPRSSMHPGQERDVRPVVERPRSGISGAAITGLAIVGGMGLFAVLEARRQGTSAPATTLVQTDVPSSAAPPPLYVPPAPLEAPPPVVGVLIRTAPLRPVQTAPVTAPLPRLEPYSSSIPSGSPLDGNLGTSSPYQDRVPTSAPSTPRQPPRNVSGQALIVDTSGQTTAGQQAGQTDANSNVDAAKRPTLSTTRARAAMLANRSTTVPQGTLISAILETAFDSTSPGFARALVQRDVHGFDGTQVLIPRGSRLIGEYGADTARGQQRAVILWSRLIRPDGVTIAIGSPAADTLGRGGVKADVNTHFLERFSGAILQSALDVGVNLAARSSRSPVIVALPGTSSALTNAATARTTDITPTLRVPAGRSVSVFVARDLDFTSAGAVR